MVLPPHKADQARLLLADHVLVIKKGRCDPSQIALWWPAEHTGVHSPARRGDAPGISYFGSITWGYFGAIDTYSRRCYNYTSFS